MKTAIRLLTMLILTVVLVSALPVCSFATEEPTLNAKYALLYNIEYNTIVYEKSIDTEIYPASFAKIMTAILAYEYKAEHPDVTDIIVKESVISAAGGTGLGLRDGEVISFDDALAAVVVGGANDAALVIADLVGGNGDGFVSMMNEKAKELGCENTYFANPTGLHSPLMKTTLRDVLKICLEAYSINDFMVMSSNYSYTVAATNMSDAREITSKNYLLNDKSKQGYYYAEAKGMNAGSTPEAGYCLASVHSSGGLTALAIVSGAELVENRYRSCTDVATLFDSFSSNYKLKSVLEKGRLICEIPISLSSNIDHLILVSGDAVPFIVSSDYRDEDMSFDYTLSQKEASAPVSQGDVFGEIQVYYKGEIIGTCDLVAQASVERSIWLLIVSYIKAFFSLTIVKIVLFSLIAILIVSVILMLAVSFRSSRRKQSAINELEREYFETQKIKNKEYDEFRRARRRSIFHSLVNQNAQQKKKPAPRRRPPQRKAQDGTGRQQQMRVHQHTVQPSDALQKQNPRSRRGTAETRPEKNKQRGDSRFDSTDRRR